jgi:predicted RNA-binding Zn ribbon-like protein
MADRRYNFSPVRHAKDTTTRPAAATRFDFVGGHPALDFHNTVAWAATGPRNDRLAAFTDLVAWARASGLITQGDARTLVHEAKADPVRASAVLAQARALRAILHDVLTAAAAPRAPHAAHLTAFNAALRGALTTLELTWDADRFAWRAGPRVAIDTLLARLTWSAAQLMTATNLARLRQCANSECGWLFLDTTRNWSRRWCSMAECGSQAKARRYYQRKKRAAQSGGRRARAR